METSANTIPGSTLFVSSAGGSHDHDFCWLSESTHDGLERVQSLAGKLDDSQFTALISREPGGNLLLLVNNLPSSRTDFLGRPIRNGFAILAPEGQEAHLRKVAATALHSSDVLATQLDGLIDHSAAQAPHSFSAHFEGLHSLMAGLGRAGSDIATNPAAQFGNLRAPRLRAELVEELERCPLPLGSNHRILVLVDRFSEKSAFRHNGVWRGLSHSFEGDHWQGKDALKSLASGSISHFFGTLPLGGKTALITSSVALVAAMGYWGFTVARSGRFGIGTEHSSLSAKTGYDR